MQTEAFKDWLRKNKKKENYISSRLSNCRRVARAYQVDLDQEFDKNQLDNLISILNYTKRDEAAAKPNSTKIEINGSLFKGLGTCRRALKLYKRFRLGASNDLNDNDAEEEYEESNDISADESFQDEDSEVVFGLESQLRDFISQNITRIPLHGRKLSLASGGVEYYTDAGKIDILATDEKGNFIVFELKRGRTPDHVIGQLVRYMGCIKQTIGKDKEVYGVIVAKTIKENMHYAKTVIPNISLLHYEVKFELRDAISGVN